MNRIQGDVPYLFKVNDTLPFEQPIEKYQQVVHACNTCITSNHVAMNSPQVGTGTYISRKLNSYTYQSKIHACPLVASSQHVHCPHRSQLIKGCQVKLADTN
jgi:hypothetical protein